MSLSVFDMFCCYQHILHSIFIFDKRWEIKQKLPSEFIINVSLVLQLSNISHNLTVLSQEALARTHFIGLKDKLLMGPSWPAKT